MTTIAEQPNIDIYNTDPEQNLAACLNTNPELLTSRHLLDEASPHKKIKEVGKGIRQVITALDLMSFPRVPSEERITLAEEIAQISLTQKQPKKGKKTEERAAEVRQDRINYFIETIDLAFGIDMRDEAFKTKLSIIHKGMSKANIGADVSQKLKDALRKLILKFIKEIQPEPHETMIDSITNTFILFMSSPVPKTLDSSHDSIKKNYKMIKEILPEAVSFCEETLGIELPPTLKKEVNAIIGCHTNNCKNFISEFIRKASVFSNKREDGPFYCAFLKIMMTYLHYMSHKEDKGWKWMDEATEEFEKELFEGTMVPANRSTKDNYWIQTLIPAEQKKYIEIQRSSRGKSPGRTVVKLLINPDFDMSTPVGDQIGIRQELALEDFNAVLFRTIDRVKQMDGYDLDIEIKGLNLGAMDIEENEIHAKGIKSIKTNETNYFQDIKIQGKWKQNKNRNSKARNFEIQLIPTGNSNEKGISHHAIFEATKNVEVIVRLFGTISSPLILNQAKIAYEKSTNEIELTEEAIAILKKKYPEGNFMDTEIRVKEKVKELGKLKLDSIIDRLMTKDDGVSPRLIEIDKEKKKFSTPGQLDRMFHLGILPKQYIEILKTLKIDTLRKILSKEYEEEHKLDAIQEPEQTKKAAISIALDQAIEKGDIWNIPL